MTIDRDAIRGGFGGAVTSMMSDQLRHRIAAQEAAEAREAAQEQREQRLRAEAFQESAIQAAIAERLEAGESFQPRWLRGESLGHTVSEFLALRSAEIDRQDMISEARRKIAVRKLMEQHGEADYGDTTAPTKQEMASRAESEARHREARIQGSVRRYERKQILKEARKVALHDSLTIAAAAERHR
jgi:hypothetical protein